MSLDPDKRPLNWAAMRAERDRLRTAGRRLAFTNGCFDLIHVGHVRYLAFARQQGDVLVVGLNSDASVRRHKGPARPVHDQEARAEVLLALRSVDYVVVFEQDEPRGLIEWLRPDVLIKGRDWSHYVSGRDVVEAYGGTVVLADMVEGRSSSAIIQAVLAARPSAADGTRIVP